MLSHLSGRSISIGSHNELPENNNAFTQEYHSFMVKERSQVTLRYLILLEQTKSWRTAAQSIFTNLYSLFPVLSVWPSVFDHQILHPLFIFFIASWVYCNIIIISRDFAHWLNKRVYSRGWIGISSDLMSTLPNKSGMSQCQLHLWHRIYRSLRYSSQNHGKYHKSIMSRLTQ